MVSRMELSERMYTLRRSLNEFMFFLRHSRMTQVGIALLSAIVLMAVFADFIAPYDPYAKVGNAMEPPSPEHPLGTNDMGQDILSELIYGARISLFIGFVAAISGTLIGTLVGIVAGYFGGVVDEVLMRITDIWLSMPMLLFTIFLASVLTKLPSFTIMVSVILAIALTSWPGAARVVRSAVLGIKERPYIEAARAVGSSDARIMFKHILPNTVPILVVMVINRVAGAMLSEASLSFLGLGDPTAKSWGMIIHYAMIRNAVMLRMWWWFLPPGIMISITVLAVVLIGIGLEEYFNPRLRR